MIASPHTFRTAGYAPGLQRSQRDQCDQHAYGDSHAGTPTILVVDDDERIRRLCETVLASQYRVLMAENGQQALRTLFQHQPHLVLLDVSMPVLDGWETCRRIRELSDVPVIMLTAHSADADVAHGLDLGADDYVSKPFSPVELLARVRAKLRLERRIHADAEPEVLRFGDGELAVDTGRRAAIVHGKEVTLTATEYKLLELLARHAGQVLTHDQILQHVWGPAYARETGYVKTYMGYLRKKIEPDPGNPRYVQSRRGLGYFLQRRSGCSAEPVYAAANVPAA